MSQINYKRYHKQFVECIEEYYNYRPKCRILEEEDMVTASYAVNIGDLTITDDVMNHEMKNVWITYFVRYYEVCMVMPAPTFYKGFFTREEADSAYNHSHVMMSNSPEKICLGSSYCSDTLNSTTYYKKNKYNVKHRVIDYFVNLENILQFEDQTNPYNVIVKIARNSVRASGINMNPSLREVMGILKKSAQDDNFVLDYVSTRSDAISFVLKDNIKNYVPDNALVLSNNSKHYLTYEQHIKMVNESGGKDDSFCQLSEGVHIKKMLDWHSGWSPNEPIYENLCGCRKIRQRVKESYNEEEKEIPRSEFEILGFYYTKLQQKLKSIIEAYYAEEAHKTYSTDRPIIAESEVDHQSGVVQSGELLSHG